MENPATWKRAELIIQDAYCDWTQAMADGMVGGSLAHVVAKRLRAAGIISDQDEPEIGWDGLREHEAKRHGTEADNAEVVALGIHPRPQSP